MSEQDELFRRYSLRQFPMYRWRQVLFSDESRFTLYRADGLKCVYLRRSERFTDACIMETDRFGGGSVMLRGRHCPWTQNASNCGQRKLKRYSVQRQNSPSVRGSIFWNLTFQQDNARPHVARVCRDFLAKNNMIPLDWLPYSPDLSPYGTPMGRTLRDGFGHVAFPITSRNWRLLYTAGVEPHAPKKDQLHRQLHG